MRGRRTDFIWCRCARVWRACQPLPCAGNTCCTQCTATKFAAPRQSLFRGADPWCGHRRCALAQSCPHSLHSCLFRCLRFFLVQTLACWLSIIFSRSDAGVGGEGNNPFQPIRPHTKAMRRRSVMCSYPRQSRSFA